MISQIGEWMLREACQHIKEWDNQGLPTVTIAVNLSAIQFKERDIPSMLKEILQETGINHSRLELEVTESVFMHEGLGATKVLERVLDLGVRLSLDDFGTGYSSLGYLSRTRFSSIKIDRSFVQAASKGVREAVAIIHAVVALAKSLGMATTAEGVETEQEHRMVEEMGCTKVQGYYFGRPLPVEEARALANQQRDARAA